MFHFKGEKKELYIYIYIDAWEKYITKKPVANVT